MAIRAASAAIVLIAVAAATAIAPPVAAQQVQVSAGQKMAYLTKPAVVRIWDGYIATFRVVDSQFEIPYVGSGSGSIIHPDGYILTNAHVVDTTKQGEEKAKETLFGLLAQRVAPQVNRNPEDPDFLRVLAQNTRLLNLTHIHHVVLPNGDALPFEIKDFGAPVGQGKDVAIVKVEVKNAPTLTLGDSEKIQYGDHVTVFGYPAAADTFDSGILDRKSQLEASITDGKLSAKKNSAEGAPILQISAPATHGNSGGPVLNDTGEVIGLLTFRGDTVNGQEVSGFAFVVPTSTALEFVKKAGAQNQQSVTDTRYREGLDLYLDGYYSKAIPKFEEVKRLFPAHSEVDRLLTDSQQKISEGKDRTNLLPWVAGVVVVLLIGLVVIAALAFFFLRRGKRAPALQQPAYAGGPSFPQQPQSFPPHAPGSFPPQPQQSFPPQQGYPPMPPAPAPAIGGQGEKTVMVAAVGGPAAQPGLGSLICTSGALMGQRFEIRPEGIYIGRDGTLSQVVISDNRVSKRHVWIGPRNGRVAVVDQGSTNGTFLNVPGSQRITEVFLNPGDTVIVSEADVARFQFQR